MIRALLERLRPARRPAWRRVLPCQPPRVVDVPGIRSVAEACDGLRPGVDCTRTATAMSLTPAGFDRSPLAFLRSWYPRDAGLRLLRRPAGGGDGELVLLAGLLHLHDLGPRLYDLVHLRLGGGPAVGLVVRHAPGRAAAPREWEAALARLRGLGERGLVRPLGPAGWDDPAVGRAGSRARVDGAGCLDWDGLDHLALGDHGAFLELLALGAAEDTHFGTRGRRGQRYLYQSVPGVRLAAKRRVEDRLARVAALMADVGVDLAGRLVLDVGCNLGMAMAQYLRRGARWCHGWDLPVVVPHAERMLLALGCTRFSLTAAAIDADRPVEEDLPEFLAGALPGCVVSYLAIRGHVGWLSALGRLPWAALIYEGHKGETDDVLAGHLAALARSASFTRGPVLGQREGRRARSRPLTVLVRPEHL